MPNRLEGPVVAVTRRLCVLAKDASVRHHVVFEQTGGYRWILQTPRGFAVCGRRVGLCREECFFVNCRMLTTDCLLSQECKIEAVALSVQNIREYSCREDDCLVNSFGGFTLSLFSQYEVL